MGRSCFESQKRQQERHESRQRLDDIELSIRQVKLLREQKATGIEILEEGHLRTAETAA